MARHRLTVFALYATIVAQCSHLLDASDTLRPLILTPLIASGQLEKARSLSEISYYKIKLNVTSYSGYFTVDPYFKSNLFFWFFPCMENAEDAPMILWLQGGPGQPSTIGLFEENGPIQLTKDLEPQFRNMTWTRSFNMLYIDSPVGTGCSFLKDQDGYAKTQDDVTNGLYEALVQFFKLFPKYHDNDFYIAGESYEGKYAPNLARKIHLMNSISHFRKKGTKAINLKGIVIGNGFVDPLTMIENDAFLYNAGLLDDDEHLRYTQRQNEVLELIHEQKYLQATEKLTEFIFSDNSLYTEITGLQQYYHLLRTTDPPFMRHMDYLNTLTVRHNVHIGNATCKTNWMVSAYLADDITRSAKPSFEFVLNMGYKVLLYSGNLDIIVGTATTVNFLKSLQVWKRADDFRSLPKSIWHDHKDGAVNGYVKKLDNFTFVVVRNAGHMAIADRPEICYDMMLRFIFDKPFD